MNSELDLSLDPEGGKIELAKIDTLVKKILNQKKSLRNYFILMKAMPKLLELDDMEEFGEFFKDDNAQDAETQLRFAYALGQPGFKYTLTHHDLLQIEQNNGVEYRDKRKQVDTFALKTQQKYQSLQGAQEKMRQSYIDWSFLFLTMKDMKQAYDLKEADKQEKREKQEQEQQQKS